MTRDSKPRTRCINAGDGVRHGVPMARDGRCAACCGRLSSGNTVSGRKKRKAALAGIGLASALSSKPRVRVMSSKVTDCIVARLRTLLQTAASEATVVSYLRGVVRKTVVRRGGELVLVTLVECPCERDSFIAEENALCGGASLRMVEPSNDLPARMRPPPLACGTVACWPLDVHDDASRLRLQRYLVSLRPVVGTRLVHVHFSPVCTGTAVVNANVHRGKLLCSVLKYHRVCRRALSCCISRH